MRKAILGIILVVCMFSSSLSVTAKEGCAGDAHPSLTLYSRTLLYREVTSEHMVSDIYGHQSVCYVYKEYYHERLLCNKCGSFVETTKPVPNVHGHTGCPEYGK